MSLLLFCRYYHSHLDDFFFSLKICRCHLHMHMCLFLSLFNLLLLLFCKKSQVESFNTHSHSINCSKNDLWLFYMQCPTLSLYLHKRIVTNFFRILFHCPLQHKQKNSFKNFCIFSLSFSLHRSTNQMDLIVTVHTYFQDVNLFYRCSNEPKRFESWVCVCVCTRAISIGWSFSLFLYFKFAFLLQLIVVIPLRQKKIS